MPKIKIEWDTETETHDPADLRRAQQRDEMSLALWQIKDVIYGCVNKQYEFSDWKKDREPPFNEIQDFIAQRLYEILSENGLDLEKL